MNALQKEIAELIIEALNITHITADELNPDMALFDKNNPIGLDSIDAIEIVMAVQNQYQVRITDQNLARSVVESISSIAKFVEEQSEASA